MTSILDHGLRTTRKAYAQGQLSLPLGPAHRPLAIVPRAQAQAQAADAAATATPVVRRVKTERAGALK